MRKRNLEIYWDLFVNRSDVFARQRRDGSYYAVKRPLNQQLVEWHLAGQITLGFYALDVKSRVRWSCVDADTSEGLSDLQTLWEALGALEIPSYIESSRRGGHLWIFLEPLSAKPIRRFLNGLISQVGLEDLEVFPKQDCLSEDGVGNLVRGPLGIHRLSGERYPFLDPVELESVGTNLAEQLAYLTTVEKVPAMRVAEVLVEVLEPEPKAAPPQSFSEPSGDIALIKERTDIYDFISQYVQLDAQGRGLCPFHDDHRPSLSVNRAENYWYCFACEFGGDVIHFYERIKGLNRGQAIRELMERT